MLKSMELSGFKSFARPTTFVFETPITAIVGPNGSGKSNTAEAFRFALGEQSKKALRGESSEDFLFHGSKNAPRANRASVKVMFDNARRTLNLDFPEIVLERTMFRDSSHVYSVNNAQVRLKDIVEILAGANIGPTGHHIISQGEADKILLVRPRDRRQIIEDALGLKVYHSRREESARKLEKTEDHIKEVRNELSGLAPERIRLEREMERLRKAGRVGEELALVASELLGNIESLYSAEVAKSISRIREISEDLDRIEGYEAQGNTDDDEEILRSEMHERQRVLRALTSAKEELVREKGRLEGKREMIISSSEKGSVTIQREDIEYWKLKFDEAIERQSLNDIRLLINELFAMHGTSSSGDSLDVLEDALTDIAGKLVELENNEQSILDEIRQLQLEIDEVSRVRIRQEEELRAGLTKRKSLETEKFRLEERLVELEEQKRQDEEQVVRVGILLSQPIRPLPAQDKPRKISEIRTQLERLLVRYEELSLENASEIEREYELVRDRSTLLESQVADLESTAQSLRVLMNDLAHELKERFYSGLDVINNEFDALFASMFGGGSASLLLVQDGEEEGVDIDVSLPFKRVRGLSMLSGGERSLVSIALVFALSRVNPPPFLILDETDAALDEANSRRYGDCIQELSKHSQLVIITHNRETMSRAGVLYGVTMGNDGISRLLSVKLEDAQAFAAR